MKPESLNHYGYNLHLADGQKWQIVSTEEVRLWMEGLASVMRLETCRVDESPKLIFIRKDSDEVTSEELIFRLPPYLKNGLPPKGWILHRYSKLIQFWFHPEVLDVICEMKVFEGWGRPMDILKMQNALYPIYRRAQEKGGLPFHAALIEYDGHGVLVAGEGGTGKSTCCRRLPYLGGALCDDAVLVVRDARMRYLAHPFPTWTNCRYQQDRQRWNTGRHLPLAAVFFLEQAGQDEVVPVKRGEAAIRVYQQACPRSWRKLDFEEEKVIRKELFNNACELARSIPAFLLRSSLTGQFWKEMEKVL